MSGGSVERKVEVYSVVDYKGTSGSRVVMEVGPLTMGADVVHVAVAVVSSRSLIFYVSCISGWWARNNVII